MKVRRQIIDALLERDDLSQREVQKLIKKFCRENGLSEMPTKVELLGECNSKERERLKQFLTTKPMRSISGVSTVTIVSKPAPCPGTCIYCPKGVDAPQSYTGMEPAIQRGIRNDYDPFLQTRDRLSQYGLMGHPTDKIEVIILGGTFLALDEGYQEWFIKRVFDALNDSNSRNLKEAKKMNETAQHRCVGLTIETRADYCFEGHIDQMLKLGATRVEIGAQSIYPKVLKKVRRGHSVKDIVRAIQLTRDSCLKCTLHVMPGLFVNLERDLEQFKILFKDPKFKPDSLKIYPTLVIEDTELYDMWKKREYKPLTTEKGVKLLTKAMKYVPKYCRIIRVQRDIPSDKIVDGVAKSNLRELVERECERRDIKIQEIRYREVGRRLSEKGVPDPNNIKLCRLDYDASGGKEIFLSFEDVKNDALIGFLRLRMPSKSFRPEIDEKTGLVRELHVYGPSVPIGSMKRRAWQHRGYGKKLLKEAERIAKGEFEMNKMVVISGIGVREYYYRFGYKREGPFVSKVL